MVDITSDGNDLLFTLRGIHKILAFKNELRIPRQHIVRVYTDPKVAEDFKGIRAMGTHIPYGLKAGTFYQQEGSATVFMDISDKDKAIIVELKDEEYKQLIIEVDDPLAAIDFIHHFTKH
jgi:hypothetical protein